MPNTLTAELPEQHTVSFTADDNVGRVETDAATKEPEPPPPERLLSGEELIRQYANFLHPHVQVQTWVHPQNGAFPQECDVCGTREEIQGELRLLVHGIRMRCARVGMPHEDLRDLFETEICTAEQFRRKVKTALMGRIVAGESE